jgi:hypothetical protein
MPESKPRLDLLGDSRNFTLPAVFRNDDSMTCDTKKNERNLNNTIFETSAKFFIADIKAL